MKKMIVVSALLALTGAASAQVRISEWMYSGNSGEYIEITNTGNTAVPMSGWSFDDDSRTPGSLDLSSFGTLRAGESAIITEIAASDFRVNWSLAPWVKIIGLNANNLGRNDEINIYNGTTLIDRLTFGDQNFSGTIRTQNKSGNTGLPGLGMNDCHLWALASLGDAYGSYASAQGDLGNPGEYAPLPAPGAMTLGAMAVCAAARRNRK